ncbi:YdcF family protein [Ancylobacter sp. IITR112]|uniref:YdcF family protein n=1 Tax=Ancylobacter sp. IITR112 TaxID=3138073 RepID=UPI00352AD5CC
MFYTLSKAIWLVAVPSTFLTVLAAAGLIVWLRWPSAGATLVALGVGGLLLFGLSPLARMLLLPLESRFPAYVEDGRRIDGIIVLGGGEQARITAARGQPSFADSAERVLAMGELARRYPHARVVFTGGGPEDRRLGEASVVRLALPQIGLPEDRVMFEPLARNTAENARFAKQLVQPRPDENWLLVTSAFHMPRAVGVFRRAGFPVIAYPVDYRTAGPSDRWRLFRSVAYGLNAFDLAVHEWLGLAVYYLTGRIGSPFPAPLPDQASGGSPSR